MGYTTEFRGGFDIKPPMTRKDVFDFEDTYEGKRFNPATAPGYYCQWQVTDDGTTLQWDGGEKFYNYTEWLRKVLDEFFEPRGYVVIGEVKFRGEEFSDAGTLVVKYSNRTCKHTVSERRG